MPTLSAAENADIVAQVSGPSIDGEQVVDLYRSPAVGNKTGAPVLHGGDPDAHSASGRQPKLIARAQPVNAATVSHLGKAAVDTDLRYGDELRDGTKRYKVEGVGVGRMRCWWRSVRSGGALVPFTVTIQGLPGLQAIARQLRDTALPSGALGNGCANHRKPTRRARPAMRTAILAQWPARKPPRCRA